jgi:hypothetical protein
LGDQAGQQATVVFADQPAPAADGQRVVFFTEPFACGETIGVRAAGTVAAPEDLESLAEAVGAVTLDIEDQELILITMTALSNGSWLLSAPY